MKKQTLPWAVDYSLIADELQTWDPVGPFAKSGLSTSEAENRLKTYGENTITQSKKIRFWDILLEEVREPLILLLLAIGVIYSILGDLFRRPNG